MTTIEVYSSVFLEGDSQWSARPSAKLLRHIYRGDEGSSRWVAVIRNRGREARIAIGGPVEAESAAGTALFMPPWFLESIGLAGNGERAELAYTSSTQEVFDRYPITVTFEKSEAIPRATRLVFRAKGDIPEWLDVREILEEPLSQLGVLQEGQVIPVPAFEQIQLVLEVCEPTGPYVFLDGEAALEILPVESQATQWAGEAQATQWAGEAQATEWAGEAQATGWAAAQATELAGEEDFNTMMVPASAPAFAQPVAPATRHFVAFQGTGYSLTD